MRNLQSSGDLPFFSVLSSGGGRPGADGRGECGAACALRAVQHHRSLAEKLLRPGDGSYRAETRDFPLGLVETTRRFSIPVL